MKKIFSFLLFIILLPYHFVEWFIKGFSLLSLFLSRGFYFYLEKFFCFLHYIIPFSFFDSVRFYFRRRQEQPEHFVFLIIVFLFGLYLFDSTYRSPKVMIDTLPEYRMSDESTLASNGDSSNYYLSMDFNLYQFYGKYSYSDIDINSLKEKNSDTVLWMMVEGTNINYPVVQTDNNDYYLNHSFDRSYTTNGWPFMDYRNKLSMEDTNTIFYAHNLLNGTAFGSLSNLFETNREVVQILIVTEEHKYTYQVFSVYETTPEVYYLQTNFNDLNSYQSFLNTIVSRNQSSLSADVDTGDRIITLSTCTDDNKGRRVVHAKLVSVE